jgi:hypothetical protein
MSFKVSLKVTFLYYIISSNRLFLLGLVNMINMVIFHFYLSLYVLLILAYPQ